MSAYSFLDVTATLYNESTKLSINLGVGAGVAEEGITWEPVGTKNVVESGADGSGTNNLIASNVGIVTVRLLKTSPANKPLSVAFNEQTAIPFLWGSNIIKISMPGRGDVGIFTQVALQNLPSLTWAQEAGMNEWIFDCIDSTILLGSGTPESN